MAPHWSQTFHTFVWIFNTGRGLSVCIRFPHNIGLLYDLGASQAFSPAAFVRKEIAPHLKKYKDCRIAQTVVSHPHADHIAELDVATKALHPALLTCPNDKDPKEAVDFARIEREDNRELIAQYQGSYANRRPPLQTIQAPEFGTDGYSHIPTTVEYGLYYLRPPLVAALHQSSDQDYGNGLSLVLYLRYGQQSLLLTGDITPAVFRLVLEGRAGVEKRYTRFRRTDNVPEDFHSRTSTQPILRELLTAYGLTALVAPHHGLESCYCPALFQAIRGCKTSINVISEKRQGPTEGCVDSRYQSQETSRGAMVDIDGEQERRYSASTRNGHHILLILQGTQPTPRVYLRSNPNDLLKLY